VEWEHVTQDAEHRRTFVQIIMDARMSETVIPQQLGECKVPKDCALQSCIRVRTNERHADVAADTQLQAAGVREGHAHTRVHTHVLHPAGKHYVVP
jgi:hypothetical protein